MLFLILNFSHLLPTIDTLTTFLAANVTFPIIATEREGVTLLSAPVEKRDRVAALLQSHGVQFEEED